MTDGRIFPQEAAAAMLALRGWQITPPEHSGWVAPTFDCPTEPSVLDAQASNWLKNAGWDAEPPPADWQPAFTPKFYEAGGDEEGQVYCRVDLPEGLYYAFQDAARDGLANLKARRDKFQTLERNVADLERNAVPGKKRDQGVLDGTELSSREIRAMVGTLNELIGRWEDAMGRADTRSQR